MICDRRILQGSRRVTRVPAAQCRQTLRERILRKSYLVYLLRCIRPAYRIGETVHKSKFFLGISLLLLASLACNALSPAEPTSTPVVIFEPTNPPQPGDLPATEADVPRVSLEEAFTAFNAGAATFVDVRDVDSFLFSHIAGALSVPLDAIETDPFRLGLDKEQWIITYCT